MTLTVPSTNSRRSQRGPRVSDAGNEIDIRRMAAALIHSAPSLFKDAVFNYISSQDHVEFWRAYAKGVLSYGWRHPTDTGDHSDTEFAPLGEAVRQLRQIWGEEGTLPPLEFEPASTSGLVEIEKVVEVIRKLKQHGQLDATFADGWHTALNLANSDIRALNQKDDEG